MLVEGVTEVNVTMTAREQRAGKETTQSGLKNVRTIIGISSCKGGVGKSTIAAWLSVELSRRGFKVGLLDADLFGPSIPTLFNLHDVKVEESADKLQPLIFDNLKLMSFGFLIGDSPAVMRGPMVSKYINHLLHNVEWGELDYLFLDMPPGTGDIQLTISQSIKLNGAVIITTPQILSLADVGKGIMMFDKVSVPVIGVVENMAYYICDNCEKKHYIFGGDAAEKLKERFGVEILARLPITQVLSGHLDGKDGFEVISDLTDQVIRAYGKSKLQDISKPDIHLDSNKIVFFWPDGTEIAIDNIELRANCKCATCVHEITGEQLLLRENIEKDIHALEVHTVGNYAVSIKWSDGHSTGLFPYSLILGFKEKS
jgi:Mrp family chromosome partitioning ATPase/DUF971 family protein